MSSCKFVFIHFCYLLNKKHAFNVDSHHYVLIYALHTGQGFKTVYRRENGNFMHTKLSLLLLILSVQLYSMTIQNCLDFTVE